VQHIGIWQTVVCQVAPCYESSGSRLHINIEKRKSSAPTTTSCIEVDEDGPFSFAAGIVRPMTGVKVELEFSTTRVSSGLPGLPSSSKIGNHIPELSVYGHQDASQLSRKPTFFCCLADPSGSA